MNSHGAKRHSRAIIDLEALRQNYQYLKTKAGGNYLIAVVKADAYGHGALETAHALPMADAFAVATTGEAVALRKDGITQKILVMGGFVDLDELQICVDYKLDPVLHHQSHLDCLQALSVLNDLAVWLKVDSGMGRLGFPLDRTREIIDFLSGHDTLGSIRLMTHLANADVIDDSVTEDQLTRIKLLGLDDFEWGIANSAGILGWPGSHRLWARTGIALYGADPMSDRKHAARQLKPVMSMKSRVLAVNHHLKGDSIGYGGTYTCSEDMTIAVVATGYADGYPRYKTATAKVEINDQTCDVIGRVSMDMITTDVSHLPEVRVGDEVTLFGTNPDVNDLADCSATIAYEILCNVGAHVQREYVNQSG